MSSDFKKHKLKLKNEAIFQGGFPFNSKNFSIEEGFPLLRIRDISSSEEIKTFYNGSYPEEYIVSKGDMVIGMDGDFNIVKWHKNKALLNQRTLRIKKQDKSNVDLDYLYYFLIPTLKKINDNTPQTTVKHLSISDISDKYFEFPDKTEQQKIAEILGKIDQAIENSEKIIRKQEKIKTGLMQDLLTKGIDEHGNIRNESTHKFKDSELGRIPEEWGVVGLEDITISHKSGIKMGPFGSQLKRDYFVDSGFKVYGQENAFFGDFSIGDRKITEERFQLLNSCELKPGDMIISMMGTIGRCAIVPEGISAGIIDSHLIRIRIDERKFSRILLKYIISDYLPTYQQIKNLSVGSIMEGLSSKILKKLLFPLPKDILEQERIINILSKIDQRLVTEKNNLLKLQKIKTGLMQDLLSGIVRTTHLID